MGYQGKLTDFVFSGSKITADGDCSHEIKRRLVLGRNAMNHLGSTLKSRDITLPTKVCIVKAMIFPVVMYGFCYVHTWTIKMDHKENWAPKNWCFWTVMLEKTLQVPLHNKVKAVNPKGNHSWCWSWNSNTLATCCKTWTQKKTLILGMTDMKFQ